MRGQKTGHWLTSRPSPTPTCTVSEALKFIQSIKHTEHRSGFVQDEQGWRIHTTWARLILRWSAPCEMSVETLRQGP